VLAYDRSVLSARAITSLFAAVLIPTCAGCESSPPTDVDVMTGPTTTAPPAEPGARWPRFGFDPARTNVFPTATGITAENVSRLRGERVALPGTADSSPIYVPGLFVLTTSYGKTVAVNANTGQIAWTFVPDGIESWEGTSQITQSSPVADPDDPYVYSYSPDGRVHKLALADGKEVRSGGWPVVVTKDPSHEKSAPALNLAHGLVLLATGGYIGDAPPYQGHVVAIDKETGDIVNVFNALCSEREGLLDPASCPESGSAIWGRGGVVVVPGTGTLLVSTGDGAWNGSTDWGDSLLELSPDAGQLVGSYTPENEADLDASDIDLASASPAFVPPRFVVQGGKDGLLRLLDLDELSLGVKGGEVDTTEAPGGAGVFTAPAVWRGGGGTWLFVANSAGTAGYILRDGPRLGREWESSRPGTSPVLAGGLLYVYDPGGSGLHVYDPESGHELATLPAGAGHWSSPIVIDRLVALPEGSANDHDTKGILIIYRLP
jgi:outer membrane protein assembly factor BamB